MSRKLFHVSLCLLWIFLCQAAGAGAHQAPFAATPGEPACPGKGGLVKARVVAIDQAIWLNRLGASLPNGMIFALERDVCAPASDGSGCSAEKPSAGNAVLRPDQRPRPLVLRVNQDQCLEVTFTNWLSSTAQTVTTPVPNAQSQPSTRAASLHLQGMEWVASSADDGSWVGKNASSLVQPGGTHVYTLYAAHEGTFLLYSTADTYTTPTGAADGGQVAFGLFGAVHVEPKGAEWYRSQVTAEDLKLASAGQTPGKQPVLNYRAVYPPGHERAGVPILNMLNCPDQARTGCPDGGEIVHGDLTALITGRGKDGQPGRFPAKDLRAPVFNPAYALPDRLEPYREITIIYHEIMQAVQAFDQLYGGASLNFDGNGADNYAFNYGSGGIASEIVANRLGVGPMGNCTSCKYEEFFLTSWAVGDPAMVVDTPATDACTAQGTCSKGGGSCNPDTTANCNNDSTNFCQFTGYSCDDTIKATKAFYPDDPSNVYHSYMSDHTKFRILHAGPDLHHLHHQHAHQWLHTPDSPAADYTDSQSLGPGAGFTLEMVYNGSGNVNQTVGDSIFHCHFYPHFAGGMWALWRVHDVFEDGSRSLPDGEITQGTPIPAVVPLPTLAMAPMPGKVRLTQDGRQAEVCDDQGGNCVSVFSSAKLDPERYKNPGFPFFIPGIAGQRGPHPPLDFAKENPDDPRSANLDGGLPRHIIRECPAGQTCVDMPALNAIDFSKTLEKVSAFELPEDGTAVEQLAMGAHAKRFHLSYTPENRKNDFILNGLPPVPGAPFADPCIAFRREGGKPEGLAVRRYKAAAFQTDAIFNKEGWHFPQQRMLALWGDVTDALAGTKPPEPLFFRANSGECIEYTHANLVPNVYELDDFQVRTPTDILGQHIHLVKFDVTSSDGATNGFNYEDGTLSPDEVSERIRAINEGGGLEAVFGSGRKPQPLTAKAIPFFGAGPGGRWLGAQATIQRWYSDPLFDGCCHDPVQPGAKDRTLRTVFTHDHFGPSTHQQAGLYAGLVIEPPKSLWYENEKVSGGPFGGTDPATGRPLPGRTVQGPGGSTAADGGPTTWQAVIETPDLRGQSTRRDSFREFLLEMQDTTLTYAPFPASAVSGFAAQGFCADTGASCTPATATKPAQGCSAGAVCIGLGFCSNNPKVSCKPATWRSGADISACGNDQATCNLVPGVPGQAVAYAPFLPGSSSATVDSNVYAWGTLPIDPPNKIAAEVITLAGGTNSFSVNYRSEPLYPRINSQRAATLAASSNPAEKALAAQLDDLSHAYRSLDRGALGGLCAGTAQFCTTDAQCGTNVKCELITKAPYAPLTKDVGPGDPYTPLLRAYAGDDVQIRTLTGAHINPHNFTLHGLKWLAEGSFVDSGWRASQTMGISEHFEQLFRVPSWVSAKGSSDYLYMGGAAAIEQAGGNWGLLRAYGTKRDDLRLLPQNQNPGRGRQARVCPADPSVTTRRYTVVATTAKQALGGSLTFNARTGGTSQAAAILYFKLGDLKCPGGKPGSTCTAKDPSNPEPLVLRANAGDCLEVTLHNVIDTSVLASTAGASSPNLLPIAQTDPPTFAQTCGGTTPCLASAISTDIGLHPQLVSYNVSQGDAFNAGNNPVQTVAPGASKTYTWYAGNIDTSGETPRHIPIEFGAANLLPSDVINHYQLGLFGALIIEPRNARGWKPEDGTTAVVRDEKGRFLFREFVLAMEDGVSTSPLAIGNDAVNAFNYKTEPLASRTCAASGDFSCVLSSTAALCSGSACGDPQTPILEACAGEQVRLRLLHPGGINTNNSFEVFGHVWAETPYMSQGPLGCASPTTHTNLHASSVISTERGCTLAKLGTKGPLALYGPQPDTLSEWQGFRLGHGPTNHFDVLFQAGGRAKVPGDYLYRSYPAMHFRLGSWGIFRVEDAKSDPALCARPKAESEEAR